MYCSLLFSFKILQTFKNVKIILKNWMTVKYKNMIKVECDQSVYISKTIFQYFQ